MTPFFKIITILLSVGFLFSCAKTMSDIKPERLPRVKDAELNHILDSLSTAKFDYFYSKISTKFTDSTQNVNFKTSVRITQDSAINALITFAKIPVLNSLVTKDSVFISDKREKCYITESLEYIRNNFTIDFTYRNVEELVLGLPIDYDTNDRYFQINDPFTYTMSSHRKREIKKIERKQMREIITFYRVSDDLTNLRMMRIESPEDSAIIQLDYLEREWVDGFFVPTEVDLYLLTPKKEINIRLEYRKTRMNEAELIYFVIPESYERCE